MFFNRVSPNIYNVSTYRYFGKLNRPAGSGQVRCMWFKPDGTRLFWIDLGTLLLRSIDLNSAWDLTSGTSNGKASAVALLRIDGITGIANPNGVALSDDGTAVFVSDTTNTRLLKYTLSTAWDPSSITNTAQATATQDVAFMDISGDLGGNGLYLDPSGTRIYSVYSPVRQYTMSTPLDLSTMTATNSKALYSNIFGLSLAQDGKKLIVSNYSGVVNCYNLSTAYDITTAAVYGSSKQIAGGGFPITINAAYDMYFRNDGNALYAVDGGNGTFHQWFVG